MKDENPKTALNIKKKAAWEEFKKVLKEFLVNKRTENCVIINEILEKYHSLGSNMSLKIYFLHAQLNFFADHCGDEHCERFYQDIVVT